ncbi:hypothetical protein [Microbacterium sp. LWH10-1.2]|uniref:hypothetical protein n=1 Tax=Microbacterium sp. LWH10-1.2 TaxID=3135255 RepID=UPI0031395574
MAMTPTQADLRMEQNTNDISAIYELLEEMNARLAGHDLQLGSIGVRLDGIDGRLDGLDGRLDGIDGRLDGLSSQMTEVLSLLKSRP